MHTKNIAADSTLKKSEQKSTAFSVTLKKSNKKSMLLTTL